MKKVGWYNVLTEGWSLSIVRSDR